MARMRRLSWWPPIVVAALSLLGFGVTAWGARTAKRAHDCLANGVVSAEITGRGCELHTTDGVRVVALDGPGFGTTVAVTAVSAVLLVVLVVLLVRRLAHRTATAART